MQLVKEELEKSSSSPRWTYKIGSVYIKTIPFANGTDDIDKQIALINDVVNHELVLGHEIITLDTEWDTEKSKLWNKNKYLKYAINEIEGSVADPRLYCKIHTLMEDVVPLYVEHNVKLFPYALTDVSSQNIIGGKLVDWDDVILGHEYTKSDVNYKIIDNILKTYEYISDDSMSKSVIQTCIGYYESYIANTVLEESIDKERVMNDYSIR